MIFFFLGIASSLTKAMTLNSLKFSPLTLSNKTYSSIFVNAFKALSGLALVKIISVYGGPSQLAVYSNFTNILLIIVAIISGSVQTGVTVLTSKDQLDKGPFLNSIILFFTTALISFLFLAVFSLLYDFPNILMGIPAPLLFILAIPFGINIFYVAYENAFLRFDKILVSYLIVGIVPCFYIFMHGDNFDLPLLITLIISGNLLASFLVLTRISISDFKDFLPKVNFKDTYLLIRFGAMSAVSGIVMSFSQVLIRNDVTLNIGLIDAGYWDALYRVSTLLNFFIIAPILLVYLPKISVASDKGSKYILALFKDALKQMTILFGVAFFALWLFGTIIVNLIFSPEFQPISQFLIPIAGIEFIKAVGAIFLLLPVALKKFKFSILNDFIYFVIIFIGLLIIPDKIKCDLNYILFLLGAGSSIYLANIILFNFFYFIGLKER
ncbi:MAG: hypothetical protein ACJ0HK_07325 [Akkermansiaceae bacterium]